MLTKKQMELLEMIRDRMAKDGVPPSFDEMKDALNLRSKSGIHRLVTALEERGFIRRLPNRARALEIIRLPDALMTENDAPRMRVIAGGKTDMQRPRGAMVITDSPAVELPLMGRIAAGVPIEAVSEATQTVCVPGTMVSGSNGHYALEVWGDSMIDAGINDGDVVVIREQSTADNGEIVVALVDDLEVTLKYYRRQRGMVLLEAANKAYETRILPEDRVKIQGRLVGLIRSY